MVTKAVVCQIHDPLWGVRTITPVPATMWALPGGIRVAGPDPGVFITECAHADLLDIVPVLDTLACE